MAETLGSLIDKISIVNVKIFFQEQMAQEPGAGDHQVAEAKRKISVLNLHRAALTQEIDEMVLEISKGNPPKVFSQAKDYSRRL